MKVNSNIHERRDRCLEGPLDNGIIVFVALGIAVPTFQLESVSEQIPGSHVETTLGVFFLFVLSLVFQWRTFALIRHVIYALEN